ncbi:DUF6656 family protein [Rhizobium sp. BK376]|uniref:DUF6656 family protein n=1 Tax=Rhizobium sp. BK376 TaxID=2512149 RepID=UPI00104D32A4|nr:DUF6656 family protein [Rhizobium sp. BK376]TCR91339.1 hypothetical protein EV561_103737 [Rhizobium sp. BK376]
MAKLRYFDARKPYEAEQQRPATVHSEFLRTGRIIRTKANWLSEERRYLTHEEVAERTAAKLQAAGEKTHDRLNNFHRAIQFPKMIFHRTLADSPHLGYCHVTASRTQFAKFDHVNWAFYIANFFAKIGENDNFFEEIDLRMSRMYFAVAVQPNKDSQDKSLTIDRTIRSNGVLFRTHDPQVAIRNVLLLGARNEQLREIIRQL